MRAKHSPVNRERKRERIEARISPDQKELIERAAELEGRSLTDFIVTSAAAAARESILTHQVLKLSKRDSDLFFAVMENPPELNDNFLAAARRYREATGR